jgi:hypothetical protein
MTVLTPNDQQFRELNGYRNGIFRLEFIKDGSGRYIALLDVLTYEPFREVWDKLNELERIEFTPIPEGE